VHCRCFVAAVCWDGLYAPDTLRSAALGSSAARRRDVCAVAAGACYPSPSFPLIPILSQACPRAPFSHLPSCSHT
jgi:hypothetical protein